MPMAFFFLLAFMLARSKFIIALEVVLFIVTGGTILFAIGSLIYASLVAYERYRTIRAHRKKEEQEADVKVVVSNDQVFIRDLNHNAWWRAAHLDSRFYANSQYTEPTETEQKNWLIHQKPTQKLIESGIKSEVEQPDSLYALLRDYPHLMLIGGTNSGKTHQMSNAIEYRLKQYPQAKVIWLSTHTNLDANIVHPQAECIQRPECIAKALQCIFSVYKKRRDGIAQDYQIILAMDEWPEIVDEVREWLDAGEVLKRLSRGGRKVSFNLILASHGANVKDLGISGHSSVKHDFAEVYLSQKLTERNLAVWQQLDKKSSRVEITLPGPFTDIRYCICGNVLSGKQEYCSNACKQRAYRERNAI
jgi:hypothetical protein